MNVSRTGPTGPPSPHSGPPMPPADGKFNQVPPPGLSGSSGATGHTEGIDTVTQPSGPPSGGFTPSPTSTTSSGSGGAAPSPTSTGPSNVPTDGGGAPADVDDLLGFILAEAKVLQGHAAAARKLLGYDDYDDADAPVGGS